MRYFHQVITISNDEVSGTVAPDLLAPTSFRHVGLTVGDIERSLGFWRDAMGLVLVARQEAQGGYLEKITGEPGAHTLQAHLQFPGSDAFVELLQYVAPAGQQIQLRPRDPGSAHIAVTCRDVGALLEKLVGAGGVPFGEPVVLDHGVNRGAVAVYLRDPDQHIVELVQPAAGIVVKEEGR